MNTRLALTMTLLCAVAALPRPAAAATPLKAERVASGFTLPLQVTAPPGDRERLFVVEQRGKIHIVRDGAVLPRPFLDLSSVVSQSSGERGLLGLAFHPDFALKAWLYVNYTRTEDGATMVVRYEVSADDPDSADPDSATVIFGPLAQPYSNHNGGCLAFGPDGKLYVSTGDGGSGGDPFCNAQSGSTLLGKILRLDDDGGVPLDNPFVGNPQFLDEIWAYGLRNPWRFSFDRQTGDLYIGDVGQRQIEEIDILPQGSGGGANFGWSVMEGTRCFTPTRCAPQTPACGDSALTLPVYEYTHALGCSVTGGHVYRGCAIPDLDGEYFFGDFCSARVWSFQYNGSTTGEVRERTAELASAGGPRIDRITSFGEDGDGEIYVVDRGGEIFKIVPGAPAPAEDLGSGRPGGNGRIPELSVCGLLDSGNEAVFTLRGAAPSARATLFVGTAAVTAPNRDDGLVPAPPRLSVPMRTDESGEIEFTLPGGGGPHELIMQFRISDRKAEGKSSLSNAVRVTWRP